MSISHSASSRRSSARELARCAGARTCRESRHIDCYGWYNGTAPTVGPGQVVSDLASYRNAIGWPAWSIISPPSNDYPNELYQFNCKEVYSMGIALLMDSLYSGNGQAHRRYNQAGVTASERTTSTSAIASSRRRAYTLPESGV